MLWTRPHRTVVYHQGPNTRALSLTHGHRSRPSRQTQGRAKVEGARGSAPTPPATPQTVRAPAEPREPHGLRKSKGRACPVFSEGQLPGRERTPRLTVRRGPGPEPLPLPKEPDTAPCRAHGLTHPNRQAARLSLPCPQARWTPGPQEAPVHLQLRRRPQSARPGFGRAHEWPRDKQKGTNCGDCWTPTRQGLELRAPPPDGDLVCQAHTP